MPGLLNRLYTLGNPLLVGSLFLKNHYAARLGDGYHRWIDRSVLAVFAVLVAGTAWVCVSNVIHPRLFDYPSFYTAARAAVTGQDFYDPEVLKHTLRAADADGTIPDGWLREHYYLYLPPSMLLLAPLGLLDYRGSLALHYAIQVAFLVGAVLLLHRLAPVRHGWRGAIEMMVLTLAFRPVQAAFDVAQIVFGALFFTVLALLMLQARPTLAGLALALAALYKHLLLIVALAAGALHHVSALVAFTLALAASGVASMIAFGTNVFRNFATFGPGTRPAAQYLDPVNQSLLAALYRLFRQVPEGHGVLRTVMFRPFVAAAGVLTISTALLCRFGRRDEVGTLLRMALLVSLALLVYPNTLYNTIPLVLPGLMIAFSFRDHLPAPGWAIVAFATIPYAAASIPDGGGFVAVLATWLGGASLLLAMELRPQT